MGVSAPEEVKDTPETVSLESTSKSDVSEPVEEEAEESEEPVKESDEVGDSQLSEEPTEESDDGMNDSELSEEPTEDFDDNEASDEPTSDDEAIVPEEDHYFWHCHRYAGGMRIATMAVASAAGASVLGMGGVFGDLRWIFQKRMRLWLNWYV